jgi:hypothetical protein
MLFVSAGDMNHREEHHPVYRGWNLTHFAVKGIHMNVHVPAEENQQNGQVESVAIWHIYSSCLQPAVGPPVSIIHHLIDSP